MLQIVAPDIHTASFDGLSWDPVASLGHLTCYPTTTPGQRFERLRNADVILTNKVILDRDLLESLSSLRYIGVTATGVNNIDLESARKHKIAVSNVPGYSTHSVAQLCASYILDHFSKLQDNSSSSALTTWQTQEHFSYVQTPFVELQGKVLGILGAGAIGRQLATIGEALGMHVQYAALPGRSYQDNSRRSLEDVLAQSDVISIHCPLTKYTHGLINRNTLARMKPTAILLNTARGTIVVEEDLYEALENNTLAHAYLDVLSSEPPGKDTPLLRCPRVTITPHLAWASREARVRLIKETAKNLEAFLNGKKKNRLD